MQARPWSDLTKTSDSLFTNEGIDRVLVTYDGLLKGAAEIYAASTDMKDPLISPVYGEFTGFPPNPYLLPVREISFPERHCTRPSQDEDRRCCC